MIDGSEERACVFDIQRMSLHDGPGIRTNVFFKGCNLRCFWCHNPESWRREPEIQFFGLKCIGCGFCLSACPLRLHTINTEGAHVFEREKCTACGKCAAVCPSGSIVLTGRMMTIDEIIAAVSRDIPFYKKSDGGVTLSGGEPLLQGKFAINLLRVMRKHGLHTAVESALNVPEDILESAAGQADFFLADIKLVDEKRHREATGISNKRILENIVRLDSLGVEYCLRIPLIGGVNDDGEAMTEIAKFSGGLKRPKYVEFLPYHKFGEAKYITLGVERKTNLATPSKEEMRTLAGLFGGVEVRYQGSAD